MTDKNHRDPKGYVAALRLAAEAGDDAAVRDVADRLAGEPWPTVALVVYRVTSRGRPEAAWLSPRLTPVLLGAYDAHRST